jgi:hypothetical protein
MTNILTWKSGQGPLPHRKTGAKSEGNNQSGSLVTTDTSWRRTERSASLDLYSELSKDIRFQ